MANKEFKLARNADQLLRENRRSALAQAILALGVIAGLLKSWQKMGRLQGDFRKDISDLRGFIEQRFANKGGITVHNIDKQPMEKTQTALSLFAPKEKISEPYWYLQNAPSPLLYAGLAATLRLADRMKKAKTKLTTDAVMQRMKAEMERLAAKLS